MQKLNAMPSTVVACSTEHFSRGLQPQFFLCINLLNDMLMFALGVLYTGIWRQWRPISRLTRGEKADIFVPWRVAAHSFLLILYYTTGILLQAFSIRELEELKSFIWAGIVGLQRIKLNNPCIYQCSNLIEKKPSLVILGDLRILGVIHVRPDAFHKQDSQVLDLPREHT